MRRVMPLVLLVLVAAIAAPSAAARVALPKSIASTGDSLTRAAGTGFLPWTDNPAGSWSTGTDPSVNSHYLRLLALNPRIRGHNYNDARSGAKMRRAPLITAIQPSSVMISGQFSTQTL